MQLTSAGQIFLVSFFILSTWSFVLTKFWLKRLAQNRESSKFTFAFLFVIVFSISSFFFPFSFWVSQSIYDLTTKPTYDATIVSYSSELVDTETTDSNGHTYRSKTWMHNAQVKFQDNQNRTMILNNSVRSGDIPIIGDHIQVVYEDGDQSVQEKSWRSVLLLAASAFIVFIMGFILLLIIVYSLNKNMEPYKAFAKVLIFRVTLPLAVMTMFSLLSYSVFAYFFLGNPNDVPIWAIGICCFFILALLPLIYHILTSAKTDEQ